ncbi:cytochrome P450 [Kitasatospora cystarginea]|uniref:Cytochrome P450 n=1 Tax=Kitasatospora cystarginea TaxID=58350 RepID=A0ABN3EX52_9ACTN
MTGQPYAYPFVWPSPFEQPKEFSGLHDEPVVEVILPSGDEALLITRYEDIRAVLTDPRVSKNRNRPDIARMTIKKVKAFQSQVDMDPPAHPRMRGLIARAFTPARVENLRPRIRELTGGLLDAMAAGPQPADFAEAFAFPLSIQVICELLGVPADEREQFTQRTAPPWDYMAELIERKRANPGDDLISALIQVHDEKDGRLSSQELHWWSTMLLLAGYETSANQLCSAVVMLTSHPDQMAKLREDPALLPGAVEELLRCQVVGTSLSMLRYVTDDIEVGGVTIPRGSSVITALEVANHDPAAFRCPERFDITRSDDPPQLTFSAGRHFCVGASLARAELQIALGSVLDRFPNLRLGVPVDQLVRTEDAFTQGFTEVPVTW